MASIAVLPFVNRSASANDEYFSDGLADELLNLLSKIKGLRVTARSSTAHFKGTKGDVATIGRKLNASTLLEGSVQKTGNRIRVSVQLVNVADSSYLWSEIYDRTLEDIFAVQDDIAHSVVNELRRTLLAGAADTRAIGSTKAEVAQAARGRTTEPEAYRLYLLARHLLDRLTREDTVNAIAYLKEALVLDPAFARGWAELARTYAREAGRNWVPVGEGAGRARVAVERALSLEPELPEAHRWKGWIRMIFDWDFPGAEASTARALELAPGDASVLRAAGVLVGMLGRPEKATEFIQRSLELDPLSPASYYNLGLALHASGRFLEAEAAYRKGLEFDPGRLLTHARLSLALLAQDRGEEALAEATREQEAQTRLCALAVVHHRLGHGAESNQALQELIERFADGSPFQVAEAYAARGEPDEAFAWLARAYAQRDPGIAAVKVSWPLRSLHADPRWVPLLERLGLGR